MHRKATINDAQFIYEMFMNKFINPHLLYEMMNSETFKPIFNDLLDKEVMYVYEIDDSPIGMFKLVPLTYRSSHVGYIGSVAIHPNAAGKGNGLKMMMEIIYFAKKNGFKRLELSVGEQNTRAQNLYKKAGFIKEGILKKYTYRLAENEYINEVLMSLII